MATRWLLALGLVLPLAGCTRSATRSEPVEPEPVEPEPVEPEPVEPATPSLCGTAALRFGDYAWVPDDSRLTASVIRDDPELGPALAELARLSTGERPLPVQAQLAFANLRMQLASLELVLTQLALEPAELVELHGPAGDVVWVWPSDCPPATLAATALTRLAVSMRVDFDRPRLRRGDGSLERFPFDLVLVDERYVALAPLGRGAAVGAWLSAPRLDPDGPGPALANIDPAPIRAVLAGPALLGPSVADPDDARYLRLRVTAP